ncbi:hypothetical protein GYB22_13390 [bacterium]|nr:hypothetical protein [bacterium]
MFDEINKYIKEYLSIVECLDSKLNIEGISKLIILKLSQKINDHEPNSESAINCINQLTKSLKDIEQKVEDTLQKFVKSIVDLSPPTLLRIQQAVNQQIHIHSFNLESSETKTDQNTFYLELEIAKSTIRRHYFPGWELILDSLTYVFILERKVTLIKRLKFISELIRKDLERVNRTNLDNPKKVGTSNKLSAQNVALKLQIEEVKITQHNTHRFYDGKSHINVYNFSKLYSTPAERTAWLESAYATRKRIERYLKILDHIKPEFKMKALAELEKLKENYRLHKNKNDRNID